MPSALPVIRFAVLISVVIAATISLQKTAEFRATRRSVPDIGGLSRSCVMRDDAAKPTTGIDRRGNLRTKEKLMARFSKANEFWIDVYHDDTRDDIHFYVCSNNGEYDISESPSDRVVWYGRDEAERVRGQMEEQYGSVYIFGVSEKELDPKPDLLLPAFEPLPPHHNGTVHSTTRAARNETAFRDMLKNSSCRMRKTADGTPKPLSANTQNRYCSVLAHSHAALSRMGCSRRTMNAVPDCILSCRTLDDVLRISAVLNADKHFREHSRDIDHNNLRTALGWFVECMKLESRR